MASIQAVDPGHPEVAQYDVDGCFRDEPQGRLAVLRGDHVVALRRQDQLEAFPQGVVIVNDQDPGRHGVEN
jgi:hypothetical protein